MSAAWFCPSCQKHHAPHVETCPRPVNAVGTTRLPTYPIPGSAADVPFKWDPNTSNFAKVIMKASDGMQIWNGARQ